jgi:hypothetical protein
MVARDLWDENERGRPEPGHDRWDEALRGIERVHGTEAAS